MLLSTSPTKNAREQKWHHQVRWQVATLICRCQQVPSVQVASFPSARLKANAHEEVWRPNREVGAEAPCRIPPEVLRISLEKFLLTTCRGSKSASRKSRGPRRVPRFQKVPEGQVVCWVPQVCASLNKSLAHASAQCPREKFKVQP